MKTVTISSARRFSSKGIQKNELVEGDDVTVTLLCFEAGQRDEETATPRECLYQVLEGEALVRAADERQRLGKGKLLLLPPGTPHVLENAGGGLLVVMKTGRTA